MKQVKGSALKIDDYIHVELSHELWHICGEKFVVSAVVPSKSAITPLESKLSNGETYRIQCDDCTHYFLLDPNIPFEKDMISEYQSKSVFNKLSS